MEKPLLVPLDEVKTGISKAEEFGISFPAGYLSEDGIENIVLDVLALSATKTYFPSLLHDMICPLRSGV